MRPSIDEVGINRWLILSYGYNEEGKKANFRLVWGPSQRENRWGTFEEWQGHIFLRTFTGVKDAPKYQSYGECFILEKLVPNYQPEVLVGVKTSYEPIWTFDSKDKDGNILHPWLEAIQYFMMIAVEGPQMAATRYVKAMGDSYDEESKGFSDELENEAPLLSNEGGISMRGSK